VSSASTYQVLIRATRHAAPVSSCAKVLTLRESKNRTRGVSLLPSWARFARERLTFPNVVGCATACLQPLKSIVITSFAASVPRPCAHSPNASNRPIVGCKGVNGGECGRITARAAVSRARHNSVISTTSEIPQTTHKFDLSFKINHAIVSTRPHTHRRNFRMQSIVGSQSLSGVLFGYPGSSSTGQFRTLHSIGCKFYKCQCTRAFVASE
jgi:hypothetical protein